MVPLANIFNAIFDLGQILKRLVYIETGHSEQSPDNLLNCPPGTVLIQLRRIFTDFVIPRSELALGHACCWKRAVEKVVKLEKNVLEVLSKFFFIDE